jgi:hypothetical protein
MMDGIPNPEAALAARGAVTTAVRPQAAERGRSFGRLRLLTAEDAALAPRRDYMLAGLVAPRELSVWWGAPKCGKSFLLLRLAYGLALGRGMWGLAARPCRVLYLAAEGEGGFAARLLALRDALGPAEGFAYIAQRAEVGPPSGDLDALRKAAAAHRAELVILDTLARTFGAGNEDAAQDMGGFVRAADALREPGEGFAGCHVAVVHHGPKDEAAKTPRGSISLVGAADLVVKITKGAEGTPHAATVEHAKDDVDGASYRFRLATVELPGGDDGEARRTCIAEEAEGGPLQRSGARPTLSANARQAVRALADLIGAEGLPLPTGGQWPTSADLRAVPVERWRAECDTRGLSLAQKPDDKRRVIDRVMTTARTAGAVAVRDGLAWLPREGMA